MSLYIIYLYNEDVHDQRKDHKMFTIIKYKEYQDVWMKLRTFATRKECEKYIESCKDFYEEQEWENGKRNTYAVLVQ